MNRDKDLTVELDEKDLARVKKSARRKAMIKYSKVDPTTKVHKTKVRYSRKPKHKVDPLDIFVEDLEQDNQELENLMFELGC